MGLLQKACETYDSFEHLVGVEQVDQTPLAPVSHMITSAQIEITLDQDGNFVSARAVDKKEPKIIIPVTEESAGRTGKEPHPHPLCDQLCYISGCDGEKKREAYIRRLCEWNESEFSHPKLAPILNYVKKGTVLTDLKEHAVIKPDEDGKINEGKALVRWRVNGLGMERSGPCWTDQSLFKAFIGYYQSVCSEGEKALCMVSGAIELPTENHPKGIIALNGLAKLISAKDGGNFKYIGRFTHDRQAATISYTASQKAHNALRWIAANQGVSMEAASSESTEEKESTLFGGRTFLCWNPKGIRVPSATGVMRRLSGNAQKPAITPTQYRERLFQTLSGWKNELPTGADVVIAVFDAATSGRLALTYYNELQASDFLDRLCHWDNTCCWENGKFGIQPPSLFQIVNCAYGSPRDGKLAAEDKILRQQMQRLLSCRVDKAPFPLDIERRIVQKASNLLRYDPNTQRKLLFTACAVIQKYHYDHDQDKERWNMETDLSTKDRSFQFGRLLAVMEYAEQSYYRKTSGGKPGEDDRETNAIRMMPVFCQRPWSTYEVINKKLRTAYLPRISGWQRAFYAKQTDEIVGILNETDQTKRNHPLADTYLLGYHLQRKAMWQKKNTENNTEEEN